MKKLLALMALVWVGLAQPVGAVQQSDDTRRAQVHTELGSGYYSMGKLGIALEELNEAVRSDSKYAPAYYILGLVYMELREDAKAEENFQRALNLDPANSEAHNNYGWFLCQSNRVDDAIGHFMTALKNPLYATPEVAYLNAGLCLLKKGDEKGGEELLLRAIKYQTVPPQALFQLSELNLRRGSYGDAQFYLERLFKASAPNSESLWLGARIAHRMGNREMEANYGLQLRKKFPDSREALAYRNGEFDYAAKTKIEVRK